MSADMLEDARVLIPGDLEDHKKLNLDRRQVLSMGLVGLLGAIVPLLPSRRARHRARRSSHGADSGTRRRG